MLALSALARLWHVPLEISSIQSAMDSCQSMDTVLIQPGVYHESLNAPNVQVFLIGANSPFGHQAVVIDPSVLPGSDSLACLTIEMAPMQIDSIKFKNSPSMFPRRPGHRVGGVEIDTVEVLFRYCDFDSVYTCVDSRGLVVVENCMFHTLWRGCVLSFSSIHAMDSHFSGTAYALLLSVSGISAQRCYFSGDGLQYLVHTRGNVEISQCRFGPFDQGSFIRLYFYSAQGIISNNTFVSFSDESHGIVHLESACNGSLRFFGNLFQDVHCDNYLVAVNEQCTPIQPIVVSQNLFESCSVNPAHSRGVSVYAGNTIMEENTLSSLEGEFDIASVHVEQDSTVMRRNIFMDTEYAVEAERLVDARFNYWGDSTGPYHPLRNPSGLGDDVSDSVLFEPWYPDTNFTIENADEIVELPDHFTLSVFPNPFNSTTRISISAPTAFIASIELTNILGQRVREIHSGPIFGQQEYLLSAEFLPSGIYFLSVRDVVQNSVHSSQKIALIR